MKKEKKFNYLVGKCQYCNEEVRINQLVDIPGLCLHKGCLEDYNKAQEKRTKDGETDAFSYILGNDRFNNVKEGE